MEERVQAGDIVNFFTTVAMWSRDYEGRNPGVVLKTTRGRSVKGKLSAEVLWSTNEITHEHASYLKKV